MKICTKKMFHIVCAALLMPGVTFYVSSCKKSSSTSSATTATVSESDAAEVTTDAVLPTTGGLAEQSSNSSSIYKNIKLACGDEKDSSIVKTSATGATPAYTYNLTYSNILACNGLAPSRLSLDFTGIGTFDGPRMSSSFKSTGGFILTGLQASATQYLLSGTYNRNGTAVSKIGNKNTFTTTVQINSSNIAIDKTTDEIASGNATVTITAVSSSGKTFNFNGTITFLGGKKATLVLNSGTSYPIQWS